MPPSALLSACRGSDGTEREERQMRGKEVALIRGRGVKDKEDDSKVRVVPLQLVAYSVSCS